VYAVIRIRPAPGRKGHGHPPVELNTSQVLKVAGRGGVLGNNQLQIASLKNRTAGALRFLFLV